MIQAEKYKKIIERAVTKGWYTKIPKDITDQDYFDEIVSGCYKITIFSHSFAKAYFGEELVCAGIDPYFCPKCEKKYTRKKSVIAVLNKEPAWIYYIKQLVSIPEEKRIDFLYKFAEEK